MILFALLNSVDRKHKCNKDENGIEISVCVCFFSPYCESGGGVSVAVSNLQYSYILVDFDFL